MARRGLWGFLIGIIALALATTAIATADVTGPRAGAVAAKKCKKKKTGTAKKRKCRKRPTAAVISQPAAAPASPSPGPLQRATLTWTPPAAAITLEAFDQAGTVGYFACNVPDCANSNGGDLGNVKWSGKPNDGGPIKLTDLSFLAGSAREFSYRICLFSPNAGTIATLNYVTADGAGHTYTSNPGALDDMNDGVNVVPPGAFDPASYAPRPVCET